MDAKSSPTTTKPETPPATTKTRPFANHSWALLISFFLLINTPYTINRSGNDDVCTVEFLVVANVVLVLLFLCIHGNKKAPEGSEQPQMQYRVAIWSLAASLNAVIWYKASAYMPLALGAISWCLMAVVTLGSYYVSFVLPSEVRGDYDGGPKEPLLVCNV